MISAYSTIALPRSSGWPVTLCFVVAGICTALALVWGRTPATAARPPRGEEERRSRVHMERGLGGLAAVDRVLDRVVGALHVDADRRQDGERDNRDEEQDQGVLDHALARLSVVPERDVALEEHGLKLLHAASPPPKWK